MDLVELVSDHGLATGSLDNAAMLVENGGFCLSNPGLNTKMIQNAELLYGCFQK